MRVIGGPVNKLFAAVLLCAAPAAAEAAVSFSFTGMTDATVPDASCVGTACDATSQMVSFTLTFDTAALAAAGNTATGGGASYDYHDAGAGFASVRFASTGATPQLFASGIATDQTIAFAPGDGYGYLTIGFERRDALGAVIGSSAFDLTSVDTLPIRAFEGVLLPDFSQASNLAFSATSDVGGVRSISVGSARAAAVAAVPENATWAMMVAGFGAVGGAMRRRRVAASA